MGGRVLLVAFTVVCALVACGRPLPPTNPAISSAAVPPGGRGRAFVALAASCWMDGLWSDALGDRPDQRERSTQDRCAKLLGAIDRPKDDAAALRALDPRLVDATVRQLWRTALADEQDAPRARELARLLELVAAASREMNRSRALAAEVRAAPAERQDSRAEWVDAAQALRDASALRALLRLGGPFANDGRALGLMFALDRMDLARDLPTHLKLPALAGVFLEVFLVAAPKPAGGSTEIWLAYLGEVTAAAGRPVRSASTAAAREALAWDGILTAFAERLRASATSGPIASVARGAADRIDAAHVR